MRTTKEINDEILELESMVGHLVNSSFGDDNNAAVVAQIRVLSGELDAEEVDVLEEDEEFTHHEADSAREALRWIEGETDELPSDEWSCLLIGA